jgi:glyoxylase-like metal-dependent hydrolase (beta-lactamase superfamily II)
MKQIDLSLVETGFCRHPEVMTVRGGTVRAAIFPALVGIIVHPQEGVILFDTGYDPLFEEATESFPERLYRWLTPPTINMPIAEYLTLHGIDLGEVGHIVLSHFHGDHASGLRRFPSAQIHCARAGLMSVWNRGRLRMLKAGTPQKLLPDDLPQRCSFFEDREILPLPPDLAPFESGADVLGDGSILAVPLPGHCPGHWGILVEEQRGLHFMVADAAWSSRAIRENAPPPRMTSALLGDPESGRQTLSQLHELRRRNHELLLTPSHCAERAAEEQG